MVFQAVSESPCGIARMARRAPEAPVPVTSLDDVAVGSLVIVEGGKTEAARRGVVRFVGITQVGDRGEREGSKIVTFCVRSFMNAPR